MIASLPQCLASSPDLFALLSPGSIAFLKSSDRKICLAGYSVTRLDRNQHGGGIALYIKETLSFRVISSGSKNLELIFVTIFFQLLLTPSTSSF